MRIEVEQKFAVADMASLREQLSAFGAIFQEPELQVDCYFRHPTRDFSLTDEALRLRRVGPANWLTYKGPKLDAKTKTRREIELSFEPGEQSAASAGELLQALGFSEVAEVRKHRIHSKLRWHDCEVGLALDSIAELGDFVELEIIAESEAVAGASEILTTLATHLKLKNCERRSYLELLLARR